MRNKGLHDLWWDTGPHIFNTIFFYLRHRVNYFYIYKLHLSSKSTSVSMINMLEVCYTRVSIFLSVTCALPVLKKDCPFLVLSPLPTSLTVNKGLWWICSLLWSQRYSDKKELFFAVQIAASSTLVYTAQWQRRQPQHTEMENISSLQPNRHLWFFIPSFTLQQVHPAVNVSVGRRQTSYFSTKRRAYWWAVDRQPLPWGQKAKPWVNSLQPCLFDMRKLTCGESECHLSCHKCAVVSFPTSFDCGTTPSLLVSG